MAMPWYTNFVCAGLGACIAELVTLPIDTTKVRLQLLTRNSPGAAATHPAQSGMLAVARAIAVQEGPAALYKGIWPAMHRQLLFASLRVGLYGQISALFREPGQITVPLSSKILSGLTAGAIGITIATPTDLVKVRFQSEGVLQPGQRPRYSGVFNAYATIVREEGLRGLWTGVGPNIIRNSIINAAELVSYDSAKEAMLLRWGFHDGLPVHFAAATFAGLMATICGNPVDVIKTRVMASRRSVTTPSAAASVSPSPAAPVYSGALDCIAQIMRNEGPRAFYQGVVPQFFRITGWNIVMFVSLEQLKRLLFAVSADGGVPVAAVAAPAR